MKIKNRQSINPAVSFQLQVTQITSYVESYERIVRIPKFTIMSCHVSWLGLHTEYSALLRKTHTTEKKRSARSFWLGWWTQQHVGSLKRRETRHFGTASSYSRL